MPTLSLRAARWEGLRRSVLFLVPFVVASCSASPPKPTPSGIALEGRVSLGGTGVAGAEVFLLRPDTADPASADAAARTTSSADGSFRFLAPEGAYILMARRGDAFAFFGRNPVRLSAAQKGLHLPLAPIHPVTRIPAKPGEPSLGGRVLHAGQPVAGAQVFVYLDLSNGLRGPGYEVSEPTQDDGSYNLSVPPGTYFLAARLRTRGAGVGPMQPGDLFGVEPEFPLTLRAGESIRADIELVELPTKERMDRFQGGFATLSGSVVDSEGRPVQGIRACLYETASIVNQPLDLSDPTGPDGLFTLQTSRRGTFFLGARERLGGPPAPGERIGFLADPPGGKVDLKPGARLEGLRIVIQIVR